MSIQRISPQAADHPARIYRDSSIVISGIKGEAAVILNSRDEAIIAIDDDGNIGTLGQIFMNDGQS